MDERKARSALGAVFQSGTEEGAAAERIRIVEWLRHEADHGPVGGGPACRYVADLLERGA